MKKIIVLSIIFILILAISISAPPPPPPTPNPIGTPESGIDDDEEFEDGFDEEGEEEIYDDGEFEDGFDEEGEEEIYDDEEFDDLDEDSFLDDENIDDEDSNNNQDVGFNTENENQNSETIDNSHKNENQIVSTFSPKGSLFGSILIGIGVLILIAAIFFVLKHKKPKNIQKQQIANPQLVNYIKQTKQKGYTLKQIKDSLLNQGWKYEDVKMAFQQILLPKFP